MVPQRGSLEDSFLTVAEVAEILKLNQQTVRNWIDQGSLPALRVGRRVRIRRSDLERLLEAASTAASGAQEAGPSAEDFWSGEAVGLAEPVREAPAADGPPAAVVAEGPLASAEQPPAPGEPTPTEEPTKPAANR